MKIYIAPCSPELNYKERNMRELASLSQNQIHGFTENPQEADIILILDINFTYYHQHGLLHQYLDKCYAIEDADKPYCVIPGLYASAPASFLHKHRFRGCCYLFERLQCNTFLDSSDDSSEKKYLFSFVGGSTSNVRKRLFKMKFQRSDILIRYSSGYNHWDKKHPHREVMQKSYVDTIRCSKFVLCPRGVGLGSIRIFEVMELGVAPIIISDKWLLPRGPNWDEFALFMKESELKYILEIAERHALEDEARGRLARKAWEEYFSDPVIFNQCIEDIEDLKRNRVPILDKLLLYCYPLILTGRKLKEVLIAWLKHSSLTFAHVLKIELPYKVK